MPVNGQTDPPGVYSPESPAADEPGGKPEDDGHGPPLPAAGRGGPLRVARGPRQDLVKNHSWLLMFSAAHG